MNKGFLGNSAVKNPPVMQETRVQSLGQEDPLEKEIATHSSMLAWKIPRTEEPGGYRPWGHKESDRTEGLRLLTQSQRQATDFLAILVLYLWSS